MRAASTVATTHGDVNKRLASAMAFSVAAHAVLFLAIAWLIAASSEPSTSSTELIVSLQPSQARHDPRADRGESPAPGRERAAAREDPANPEARVTKPLGATDTVIPPDQHSISLQPESAAPISTRQAASDPDVDAPRTEVVPRADDTVVAELDVVTTVSQRERVATSGTPEAAEPVLPVPIPLSTRQAKMLNRKFREWTENFHKLPVAAGGLSWRHRGQEYTARFSQLVPEGDTSIEQVIVEVSTEENGKRLTTEMRMKRLAFSHYAQFVNRWDRDVQVHNDELDGRFHSNSEINLTYSRDVKPTFHGKVTTSARRINVVDGRGRVRRDQMFLGGLETGVRAIRLPKDVLALPEDADSRDDRIRHFDVDTRITFYADGTYEWQAIGRKSLEQGAAIPRSTCYLIAGKGARLHVRGTVNGRVMVYSPERIVIEDDLVYARDPRVTPGADDFLGLVSDKSVEIAPPDVTGPGDLLINAAIYAKRRFAVRNYRARDNALLYLYGSLTAGSMSATEPRYYTKIEFDERLEALRPPGFPMTNRYEMVSRDNAWRAEAVGTSF